MINMHLFCCGTAAHALTSINLEYLVSQISPCSRFIKPIGSGLGALTVREPILKVFDYVSQRSNKPQKLQVLYSLSLNSIRWFLKNSYLVPIFFCYPFKSTSTTAVLSFSVASLEVCPTCSACLYHSAYLPLYSSAVFGRFPWLSRIAPLPPIFMGSKREALENLKS